MSYLLLPPNRNVLAGRTVTNVTGTPDSAHRDDAINPLAWLTDQRPAYPIRYPAGAWGLSISVATQAVRLVVLANHSLDAAVTVGGGVSGTITPGTPSVNGILRNPFLLLGAAVAGVTTITLAGTNTGPTIIGEAFAGDPIELPALSLADSGDEPFDLGQPLGGEWMNIPNHDDGIEWRRFSGSQVFTSAERDILVAMWQAQRGNSLPSVLVQDSAVQDARIVQVEHLLFQFNDKKDLHKATIGFIEYPRYRW